MRQGRGGRNAPAGWVVAQQTAPRGSQASECAFHACFVNKACGGQQPLHYPQHICAALPAIREAWAPVRPARVHMRVAHACMQAVCAAKCKRDFAFLWVVHACMHARKRTSTHARKRACGHFGMRACACMRARPSRPPTTGLAHVARWWHWRW